MKKILLGLAVVAMAAATSAFTNASKLALNEFRFYNISGAMNDTSPANFIYQDNSNSLCDPNPLTECSAVWKVELSVGQTSPNPDDKPSDFSSYQYSGDTDLGEYNP